MALNPSTNSTMAGRITAADASYPFASSQDETAPGANNGTPYFKARADDIFGMQQALLEAASIVPSGNADTALVSEYVQAIVELASGRAHMYDQVGVADVYLLDVKTDQQAPQSYFDGFEVEFLVVDTNTVASTINVASIGVVDIAGTASAGALTAGDIIRLRFNGVTGDFDISSILGGGGTTAASVAFVNAITAMAATNVQDAIDEGIGAAQNRVAAAWVNFNGTGVVAIRDSFNVNSITDNGAGDYTVNFTVALANANYAAVPGRDTIVNHGGAFASNFLAGSVDIKTVSNTVTADSALVCVVVFGDHT